MWMGANAFAYYYPVIERYLIEFQLSPDNDDAAAWILACGIKMQFRPTKPECLQSLVARIAELARWIRSNAQRFSYDDHERHRIANEWARLERILRD